jgi:dienelactone hydrolase
MKKILVLSSFILSLNGYAKLVENEIIYTQNGKEFSGFLVYDKKVKMAPGILVVHDWLGLTDKTKEKARALADLGYIAFAADIYGKGIRPDNSKTAGEIATLYKKDRTLYRERLNLALTELKKNKHVDSSKMAAIGFCFGGTGVVELARSGTEIKAVISFHGGLDSPNADDGKNIHAKILALHGADDPFVPATDLVAFENEMRTHKVDWQLVKFGGAVHSFTDKTAGTDNSKGAAYNEFADKRSWTMMKDFLKEVL